MKAKAFEIRDRGTLVAAVAIQLKPENEHERFLIRRAGFSLDDDPPYVLVGALDGGKFVYDEYEMQHNSTYFTSIPFIREHWDELTSGQVICTEFIRGERETPKESEIKIYT